MVLWTFHFIGGFWEHMLKLAKGNRQDNCCHMYWVYEHIMAKPGTLYLVVHAKAPHFPKRTSWKGSRRNCWTSHVPSERKKTPFFYCDADWTLAQVTQRDGVPILGDIHSLTAWGPGHPAVVNPAWAGRWSRSAGVPSKHNCFVILSPPSKLHSLKRNYHSCSLTL